ncbi:MAG: flagellar motor switch protein FliN/FliY [Paracoccaceae bacterium]|jgi:flagellar motor switch protein FliN/FliY
MADNEETDMPEDGTASPDATVDETAAGAETDANDGGEGGGENIDLDELGEAGAVTTGEDGENELLAQEDPPDIIRTARDLDAVYDIPVQLSAVLGRANMQVSQLLKLGRGAVVELDRKVGEAIDIYVNNRLVARGEVVVVEERLGITMTEIIKSDRTS